MICYVKKIKRHFPGSETVGVNLIYSNSVYRLVLRVDMKRVDTSIAETEVEHIHCQDEIFDNKLNELIELMNQSN